MLVIPAIDIRGGKCVRLFKGDYAQEKTYDEDPAARARLWEQGGAGLVHVVDLDGARDGIRKNMDAIRAIRKATGCRLEVGGGIRSIEDAEALLKSGIDRVVIGTIALQNPMLVESLAELYPGRIILGADARGGKLAVNGWKETADADVYEFAASFSDLPLAAIIFTDVDTDGTLKGPNIPAQTRMAAAISCPLIASGGISVLDDIVALSRTGIENLEGVIVGTALYENRFTLPEAIEVLRHAR